MTVVLQFEPVWGTAESVTALYGIPRRRLLDLAKSGHIRARKLSPDSRSATIVFRTADVRDWLDNEAPTPRTQAFEPRNVRKEAAHDQGAEGCGPGSDDGSPTPLTGHAATVAGDTP